MSEPRPKHGPTPQWTGAAALTPDERKGHTLPRCWCADCVPRAGLLESLARYEATVQALERQLAEGRQALAFAASVIKGGEPWTETCERVIGRALAQSGSGGSDGG